MNERAWTVKLAFSFGGGFGTAEKLRIAEEYTRTLQSNSPMRVEDIAKLNLMVTPTSKQVARDFVAAIHN